MSTLNLAKIITVVVYLLSPLERRRGVTLVLHTIRPVLAAVVDGVRREKGCPDEPEKAVGQGDLGDGFQDPLVARHEGLVFQGESSPGFTHPARESSA